MLGTRTAVVVGLFTLVAAPAANAKLPEPKTTVIVPGKSIAGVKLDMSQNEVFGQWGSTSCPGDVCTWEGPGTPGKNERATVSFFKGKAIKIVINAANQGNDLKFKPGTLSKWATKKGIALGDKKSAVKRAYPAAKPNEGEAVQGFDLFKGARPNLSYTRFGTPGIGGTPDQLRYIEVAWDVCHFDASVC